MALCGCSTPPGLETVVSAPCASSVSGTERDDKAASGQFAAASALGGLCAPALAGLEPQRAEAGLYTPATPPTGGHHAGAGPVASSPIVAHLLSCTAGTLPSLFCRAAGAQCPRPHCWPDHDPALRHA